MALPVRDQAKIWGVAAAVFLLTLWFLGDVLLPFVVGGAIAYFLDPVADRLERAGLSRAAATGIIAVLGILGLVLSLLVIIPTLITQLVDLVEILPQLARDLQAFLIERFPTILNEDSTIRQALIRVGEALQGRSGELLNSLFHSALSVINVFVFIIIAPVVAVYLLLDWDRMIAGLDELLPRDHAPVIRRLASEIDTVLAGFVRGMGTVCLILGTYYAVSLMLVGLNFGLAVGFIAGLVTFIPYLGALIGGVLAIGLALFQFWGEWGSIAIVGLIFWVGQVAEGNFLTPKLVGNSVGLHPVWLLLALSVFGALFGFVGMLVAVPTAAALGVIARYVTEQYKTGVLYLGLTARAQAEEQDES
ncbi:MAG: AI-2E family transporter [Paracoccaceae bacterium]